VLVALLEWVKNNTTNRAVCNTVKVAIQNVLDETLNIQDKMPEEPFSAWDMDVNFDQTTLSHFDLLNTFDWLCPDNATD
jgi:hypothetical protein